MGGHESRMWRRGLVGYKSPSGARGRPTRRLRLEALEERRLLASLTDPPAAPDLLPISDTGVLATDNLTNLDNSQADRALQFAVGNTLAGATVTVYADGIAIGNAVADGLTTTVTTNGSFDLADGTHAITARQTAPGQTESVDSAALAVTVDTAAPFLNPLRLGSAASATYAEDVAVVGTRAYVADYGAGLTIFDISDPRNPVRLGNVDTSGIAMGVAVWGTVAYVADYAAGLEVIDVANPAAPVLLATLDTSGYAYDVAVSGTRAYVADGEAGLVIIDVANPAAPTRLGALDTPGTAHALALAGTVAYVADSSAGMAIIDVSDPAAPVRLGGYDTVGIAQGIDVSGSVAYIADGTAGVVILDVSNPAAALRMGGSSEFAWSVTVSGTRAYVAGNDPNSQYPRLAILDVSNPAAPVRLAGYRTDGAISSLVIRDSLAYVADGKLGLQVLDVSGASPPAPDLRPASDTGASNSDNVTGDTTPTFDVSVPASFYFRFYRDEVQISGDYESRAYTTAVQAEGTYRYTVAAVDVAGNVSAPSLPLAVTVDRAIPSAPDLLAVSDSGISSTDNLTNLDNSRPEKALQFAVANTIAGATVSLYADGIAIGSAVADGPTTTVTTSGSLDLADGTHAITARQLPPGGLEWKESARLTVTIDTAAPIVLNPTRLSTYSTSGSARGVVVSGTLAYVADGGAGLTILDISNPASPVRLGGYDTLGSAYGVTVSGTLAYVADYDRGLRVIDVSNPAAPVRLGTYDTSGYAWSVAVAGTRAYVADGAAGLVILDVSNPAVPVRLGGFDTLGYARGVAISGTLAYVADDAAGLVILDVSSPAAPVQVGGFAAGGNAMGVAVAGSLAYVAHGTTGLHVVDVTNPAAPVRLGGYAPGGNAREVAVAGNLVYMLADDEGLQTASLQIIDVNNPAAPVRLVRYGTAGSALGVAVAGSTAYVADGDPGLEIVDLSPPPDLQPGSDTGASNTDNVTADNTPTFSLTVPAGAYFRFYRDGVQASGDYEAAVPFTAPSQPDGTYGYSRATVDAAGNLSPQSSSLRVTIDTTPPAVANVLVAGTDWTGEFLNALKAADAVHADGYSIPVGTGTQLAPLAWANLNRIKVVFSENVSVDKADLTLLGVNTPIYDVAGGTFSYDPATFTATWSLPGMIPPDKLELRLNADGAGPVQDVAGFRLDGDWTNPAAPADTGTDTYPSGNGAAGGDFVFRFNVLPCDANQDGSVDIFDVAKFQVNYGRDRGAMPADGDFSGDGRVDIFDVAWLQTEYGKTLDAPAPMPAAAPPADVSESVHARSAPRAARLEPDLVPSLVASRPGRKIASSETETFNLSSATRPPLDAARPRRSRMSPSPTRLVAVHQTIDNASWAAAVDEVLAQEGVRTVFW